MSKGLSLTLAALGSAWILRSQSTRAREARKEQASLVSKFEEACKSLELEAIDFISQPHTKPRLQLKKFKFTPSSPTPHWFIKKYSPITTGAKLNLEFELMRLKVHRLRDEVERILYYEEVMSKDKAWTKKYHIMSLRLSEIVDRDIDGLSKLTTNEVSEFLIANNDLIQAASDTFKNKYHTEEIIWWEQALHRVLICTLRIIRQSYSCVAPLKNHFFPKKHS